jgi:hypothetical protein
MLIDRLKTILANKAIHLTAVKRPEDMNKEDKEAYLLDLKIKEEENKIIQQMKEKGEEVIGKLGRRTSVGKEPKMMKKKTLTGRDMAGKADLGGG